jgi:hypothetical protein
MCLHLTLASGRALPTIPDLGEPALTVLPAGDDHWARSRAQVPYVYELGAPRCGCGLLEGDLDLDDDDLDDDLDMSSALLRRELNDFLVVAARLAGPLRLFACSDGMQDDRFDEVSLPVGSIGLIDLDQAVRRPLDVVIAPAAR